MITILPVHTTDDDDRRHSMVDFLGIRSQKRNDDDDATYRAALDVDLQAFLPHHCIWVDDPLTSFSSDKIYVILLFAIIALLIRSFLLPYSCSNNWLNIMYWINWLDIMYWINWLDIMYWNNLIEKIFSSAILRYLPII